MNASIVYRKCSQRFKIRCGDEFLKIASGGRAIGWTHCRRATGFRQRGEARQVAEGFGFAV